MGIEFEYWSGRDPSQEGKKNFHVYEREKEGKKKRASSAFERASMEVEDDWDLSAEDLDSLERDAFQKIAQLRNPTPSSPHQRHHSATATTNPSPRSDSQEYMITNLEFQIFPPLILITFLSTLSSPHPFLDQLHLLGGLLYHFRS